MCIDCGCYGTVNPYGVGGRPVNAAPTPADVSKYNNIKPEVIGETENEDTESEDE